MAKNIQSLQRGIYIIEQIMLSGRSIRSIDIARDLGVHKSTISHLTSTLAGEGYITKGELGMCPGPKLQWIARSLVLPAESIPTLKPALQDLCTETGETSHLGELRGNSVLYLLNCYPQKALRVQKENGTVEPAKTTAVGKAIMSQLAPDDALKICSLEPEVAQLLLDELAKAYDDGVAFDYEQQTPGTSCIASPVSYEGRVIAAVGISGPAGRMSKKSAKAAGAVKNCAANIETILEETLRASL
jgi:IclR family transcriptional regulator, acetate operon repressor